MLWTEKFKIDDAARQSAQQISIAAPSGPASRLSVTNHRVRHLLASCPQQPEKGCQALPDVLPRKPLKINGGDPKRVSRFCDVRGTLPSNFRFRRFVQNRRPERPEGAEGHCFATAIYSTMLSNRNRCNSLKINARRLGYSTIKRHRLRARNLTGSCALPTMNGHLRQATAFYPGRSRGAAVPKASRNSGVLTPEVNTTQKCLKP